MADALEQRVLAAVEAAGGSHEVIEIDPALADTVDFCAHYGYALEDSANCIVVASRSEPVVAAACLVLATDRLDVNKRVRRELGVRRLSFASAELTKELTGMEIGGVTPFGLPQSLPLWVDDAVTSRERLIVGGGSRRLKLLVPASALLAVASEILTIRQDRVDG